MSSILLAASTTPSPLWYATRAGGTVALVLLTATVALGVAVGGRHTPRTIARFEVTALHRNLAVLTLVFLALHIATAVLDTFVHLGWWITVVPFIGTYRPLWLGLGTVAFDILLAVTLTSATSGIRLRMGQRRWKSVHWLAYASWPVALFHAAGTGTDTKQPLQLVLYAACLGTVVLALWWRLYRAGPGHALARITAGLATVAVPLALVVFLHAGPLAPGWAHRADAAPTTPSAASSGPAGPAAPGASATRGAAS